MLKRKSLWMALLLVFSLMTSGFQAGTASAAASNGTITVIGADGTPLLAKTPVQFTDNETAFQVLSDAVGGDVDYSTDPTFGIFINGIKGQTAVGNYTWGFYINGVQAQVGAGGYTVHDSDQLTFKYTDWTKPTNVSLKVTGENNQVIYNSEPWNVGIIDGQPTALELLQVVLGPGKVGLKDTQYGPMIISIDNKSAEGNSFWAFKVNGQMMQEGAADYHLKPDDQVGFEYQTFVPSTPGGDSNNTGGPSTAPAKIPADDLQKSIDKASQYTLANGVNDFGAIALKQAGKQIPSSYLAAVVNDIQNKGGKIRVVTDAAKYTLGILAAGGNPTNIAGYNMVESVYNGDPVKQGMNAVAFALIALDSADFPVPANAAYTREKLINELLTNQHQDGGWSLYTSMESSDPDVTAMVLTALAPYEDQAGVKDQVDKGVQYLSNMYLGSSFDNSNTAAFVVIALSALGIDANGASFTKDNVSLMQNLLSYQNSDGGFAFHMGEQSENAFSTPESFEALVAYQLYVNGKGSIYHLPVAASSNVVQQAAAQVPAASANIQKGLPLPNTATNSENIVLFGALLLMMGMMVYFLQRRRKA